jgi:hypothetical protein
MKGRYIRDKIRSPLSVKNLAEDEISLVFYYPLTVQYHTNIMPSQYSLSSSFNLGISLSVSVGRKVYNTLLFKVSEVSLFD